MQRINREELMDRPEAHGPAVEGDLRNLEVLNRYFGGRSLVRRRVGEVLRGLPGNRPLRVLDVGSGGGDLCLEILRVARSLGREVRLTSVDLHPAIQEHARRRLAKLGVRFVIGDARCLPFAGGAFDLALGTLMLHHFAEADAVRVLSELRRVSRGAVLVSDLARSRTAYAAVWLATRFTANPMTRFDGPVSVARAFTPGELQDLAAKAGWTRPRLLREPWFRVSLLERGGG